MRTRVLRPKLQNAATAAVRCESRAWLHTELPTQLERDILLTPE